MVGHEDGGCIKRVYTSSKPVKATVAVGARSLSGPVRRCEHLPHLRVVTL